MDQWGEENQDEQAAVPQESRSLNFDRLPDLVAAPLAIVALLVALFPAWGEGLMPIRGDALSYFWPLREALSTALQAGTLPYYEFTNNGGTPLWINPQTQTFYPPARLYGVLEVPHAMGFLHAAHLLLLFGGTLALLRRLTFSYPSASLAALCVALGGTFLSVSPMQDKAQTAAWLPVMLWAGLSISKSSLLPRLVLAAATLMAVLAGGLDIVVLGVLATLFAASVASAPDPEIKEEEEEKEDGEKGERGPEQDDEQPDEEPEQDDFTPLQGERVEEGEEGEEESAIRKLMERFPLFSEFPARLSEAGHDCLRAALWIGLGLGLAATQWLPFRFWIETSSWGQPLDIAELSARSLNLADLLGLIAPNLPYDAGLSEYRLPGATEPQGVYLPGLYAGGTAVLLWSLGVARIATNHVRQAPERWLLPGPILAATLGSLVCVLMAAGPSISPIGWIETNVPILSSIRYPAKWLLPAAILAAVPIAEGARSLSRPARSLGPRLQLGGSILALAVIAAVLWLMTGAGEFGRAMGLVSAALFSGLAACAAWWLLSLKDRKVLGALGVGLAILISAVDLSVHNLPLAPLADPATIVEPPVAVSRLLRSADSQRRSSGTMLPRRARLYQASYTQHDADPVTPEEAPLHEVMREALLGGIASVWGIEVMRDWLVMSPSGLEAWYDDLKSLSLARQFYGLRLAGVTHIVVHFRDDALELMPLVGRGLEEVYTPEGKWTQMVVFALSDPLPACRWTPLGMPAADGLPIVPDEDSGGVWRGRVTAGKGLLVCLRPWDPAWRVEISGKPVSTQIANGFQLAVPVPSGAHEIRMEYRPRAMTPARHIRSLSLAALLVFIGMTLLRGRKTAGEAGTAKEGEAAAEDQSGEETDEEQEEVPEGAG